MDTSKMIFVFGSNQAGIHGAGAARFAVLNRSAKFYQPEGLQGQSYAIPTKDSTIRFTLPLDTIQGYVNMFLAFAKDHPEMQFQVTRIGCGLAGLQDWNVAPMFNNAPDNCWFDRIWGDHIGIRKDRLWGTF